MQDNFNIHGWQLKTAINELDETEKIKGKDGKGCWKGYRYAGTENGKDKCVPVNEINISEEGQCPECGCKMEGTMCNECGYMEEGATFTDKFDDNPELKGGQKDLPDEVQAKIVKEEDEDHEVSMAQNSLKSIISSASQLMAKLGDNERNIPGWIQDHISKSENYIEQANQSFHELEPSVNDMDTDTMDEAMFTSANSNNPEGDTLVLRFLQGIAKKFDYPVAQAALFVKDRIKKLGY